MFMILPPTFAGSRGLLVCGHVEIHLTTFVNMLYSTSLCSISFRLQ